MFDRLEINVNYSDCVGFYDRPKEASPKKSMMRKRFWLHGKISYDPTDQEDWT
jgi:hypothetical protein